MAPNDPLERGAVEPKQHFTEPPPRYSEASLVKKLEELGIGRPSTYASIISVLQNRNYVRLESRRFIPEDRGRLVTAFLTAFFDQYVQPDFTALLENRLDEVASGALAWKSVLRDFWDPFHSVVDEVKERRVADVIDALNDLLAPRLFPPRPDGSDPRSCQLCEDGRLSLKLGRYGAFVGCSNYPECRFTRKLDADPNQPEPEEQKERIIGVDPTTSEEVILKHGPYGPYVQRGAGDDLKRSSLAPNMTPADLTLDQALSLLALPREIGKHPESDKPTALHSGRWKTSNHGMSLSVCRAIWAIYAAFRSWRAVPPQWPCRPIPSRHQHPQGPRRALHNTSSPDRPHTAGKAPSALLQNQTDWYHLP
jgi:DNA topoisomerase-1